MIIYFVTKNENITCTKYAIAKTSMKFTQNIVEYINEKTIHIVKNLVVILKNNALFLSISFSHNFLYIKYENKYTKL